VSQKKSINPFTEYYKTITNTELIIILDNPDKYQQEAVEAAKLEFNNRNLSEEQIAEARAPVIAQKEKKERQKEKLESIKQQAIDTGDILIDVLNPIRQDKPGTDKIILTISVVYGLLSLYTLISNWRIIPYFIRDIPEFPMDSLLFFTPIVLVASGTLLFWRRMKFGWILMAILTSWTAVQSILHFAGSFPSESPGITNFFPRHSPVIHLATFIFFGATVYVICKQQVREAYGIGKKQMLITIIFFGLISILSSSEDIIGVIYRSFG